VTEWPIAPVLKDFNRIYHMPEKTRETLENTAFSHFPAFRRNVSKMSGNARMR
jgi:hypothetical protein